MKTSFNTFSLLGIEKSLRKSVFKIQLNQNQNPLLTPCPDSNLKLSVVLVFALQEISENLVIVFQLIEYNGHCDGLLWVCKQGQQVSSCEQNGFYKCTRF